MSYVPPQVYAADVPLSPRERQRYAEGLFALAELADAMSSALSPPDGRFGIMAAYGVVLCPSCRAGVVRGSRCRGCGWVALSPSAG